MLEYRRGKCIFISLVFNKTFFFGKLMKSIEKQVRDWLLEERDEDYQTFAATIIPNIDNILGVRLPKLRRFAKELLKADYKTFLEHAGYYMEETMLQGMLIGLIKEPACKKLLRIKNFLPGIDNWAVCDSFCCGLKFTNENPALVWKFITPLVKSKKEYDVRFSLVMMLNYFINENYIDKVLQKIMLAEHPGFYAKMGAAWLLSVCYIKFPVKTYLSLEKLQNVEIKRKAVRKICESLRVTKEEKILLKQKLF